MNFSKELGVQQVTRRSVAKGAAWSVPTIVVGAAAPALAASSCAAANACAKPAVQINVGSANPGVSGIGSTGSFSVSNSGTCALTVTSLTFTWHVFTPSSASGAYVNTTMSSSYWSGGASPTRATNTTDGTWTNTKAVTIPANTAANNTTYNGNWNGTWYNNSYSGRFQVSVSISGTYQSAGQTCPFTAVTTVNNNNGTGF